MDVMKQLSQIGIVPVIAINDAADAVPLAQALIDEIRRMAEQNG